MASIDALLAHFSWHAYRMLSASGNRDRLITLCHDEEGLAFFITRGECASTLSQGLHYKLLNLSAGKARASL
jgi:hypothetical protein